MLAEYFIGANKFIGGSSPSIADMAIAPTLYFLQVAKYEASQNTRKRKATGVRTHQRVRFARCCEGLKRVLRPAVVREYVWHISRTVTRLRAAQHWRHKGLRTT